MLSLTIEGGDLRDAATWVGRLCPVKHATPILQGIMLDATEELTLSAYDFETAGTATIPASVLSPGRALVSGRLLAAIAKTLDPNADVQLNANENGATLHVGRNRWEMPTLPIEDYPQLPQPGEASAKLDAAALRRALDRCLPAADRTNIEPLSGCLKLESAGQELTIIATDRWRLAVATLPWDGPEINVVVPTVFAEAMKAALGAESVAATLAVGVGPLSLSTDSRRLCGRQGAAQWPVWQRFLPSGGPATEAIFVVGELSLALDRAMVVAGSEAKPRPIRLDVGPNGFVIEAIVDSNSANAEAAVSEFRGEPKSVALNAKYMREALDTLEADLATLRIGARVGSPLDLVALDNDGKPEKDYRHIVMPMSPKVLQAK